MRVAAVWQVLMPIARDVERVRIVTSSERGFDDMTISFAKMFSGSLNTVLRQLKKMTWVATAELCETFPVPCARDGLRRGVGRSASQRVHGACEDQRHGSGGSLASSGVYRAGHREYQGCD